MATFVVRALVRVIRMHLILVAGVPRCARRCQQVITAGQLLRFSSEHRITSLVTRFGQIFRGSASERSRACQASLDDVLNLFRRDRQSNHERAEPPFPWLVSPTTKKLEKLGGTHQVEPAKSRNGAPWGTVCGVLGESLDCEVPAPQWGAGNRTSTAVLCNKPLSMYRGESRHIDTFIAVYMSRLILNTIIIACFILFRQ